MYRKGAASSTALQRQGANSASAMSCPSLGSFDGPAYLLYTDRVLSKTGCSVCLSGLYGTFAPRFNLMRQEIWEDVPRPLVIFAFLTHWPLILSLTNLINVLTLNENTELLIDSLGFGNHLILFPKERVWRNDVLSFLVFQLSFIVLAWPPAEFFSPSSPEAKPRKQLLGPATQAVSFSSTIPVSVGLVLSLVSCRLPDAATPGVLPHGWPFSCWVCWMLCIVDEELEEKIKRPIIHCPLPLPLQAAQDSRELCF